MEKYIKPSVEVKQLNSCAILAGSNPNVPANEELDDQDVIENPTQIEAKYFQYNALWDTREEW